MKVDLFTEKRKQMGNTMTISLDRYEELIHKAVRLEMVTDFIEGKVYISESDLKIIIGLKGDK